MITVIRTAYVCEHLGTEELCPTTTTSTTSTTTTTEPTTTTPKPLKSCMFNGSSAASGTVAGMNAHACTVFLCNDGDIIPYVLPDVYDPRSEGCGCCVTRDGHMVQNHMVFTDRRGDQFRCDDGHVREYYGLNGVTPTTSTVSPLTTGEV